MKRSLMVGVFTLLATAASARAADPDFGRRIFRFDFDCEFRHHDDNHPASVADDEDRGCDAQAVVFAFARRGDHDEMVQDKDLLNKLSVRCHRKLIYADGALLDSGFRRVIIAANNGFANPRIVIPRRDDHDDILRTDGDGDGMEHRAFLIVRDDRLEGTCRVRTRPVDDIGRPSTLD